MKVKNIISVSQIFMRGTSKMGAQAHARVSGASGSHAVAQKTGIHSDSTYLSYRAVWEQYADYAKSELEIRNIERSTSDSVARYLEQRIEDGIARNTWTKEASALNKLAVALNMTSEKLGWGVSYDFSGSIDSLRSVAKEELQGATESRAYVSPAHLVAGIEHNQYRIAASLQYEGGARIREISNLSIDQFKGYVTDRITGEHVGVIHIDNGKGGYERDMYVSAATYERASAIAAEHGSFEINQREYRTDMKTAALENGENYSGSHGLRWNYAQEMMKVFQIHGLSYEQALQETSERMGHHRLEITEHYLR